MKIKNFGEFLNEFINFQEKIFWDGSHHWYGSSKNIKFQISLSDFFVGPEVIHRKRNPDAKYIVYANNPIKKQKYDTREDKIEFDSLEDAKKYCEDFNFDKVEYTQFNEAKLDFEALEKLEEEPQFKKAIESYRAYKKSGLTHFASILKAAEDFQVDSKELSGILTMHSAKKKSFNKLKKKATDEWWDKYQDK